MQRMAISFLPNGPNDACGLLHRFRNEDCDVVSHPRKYENLTHQGLRRVEILEMLTGGHQLFPLQHPVGRKETIPMTTQSLLLDRQSLQMHGTLPGLRNVCLEIKWPRSRRMLNAIQHCMLTGYSSLCNPQDPLKR